MTYATTADVEVLLERTFSESETAKSDKLLGYAAIILDSLAATEDTAILGMVSCSMVARLMGAGNADMMGATSTSMTAGPYSQSLTWSTPYGDMFLTKMDKRLLGVTSGYIGTIRPVIGGCYD